MRIRDYVNAHGVDRVSVEDFYYVGSKVSTDPSRLILVGGQAIETWGHYFKVPAPSGDAQPLTEDIDWYGDKKSAIWLCKQLGRESTELNIAEDFDSSPNVAVAFHQRPDGRVVLLDFLKTLAGLDPEEVRARAVQINVGPVSLYVLHPLLCLRSRLANLHLLQSKRTHNGKQQALWSIRMVGAYLEDLVNSGAPQRQVIKACTEVAEAAEFKHGPYCYDEFQIDPLDAMSAPLLEKIGGLFASEDWPRRRARIEDRRAKRLAHQLRMQQRVTYTFTVAAAKRPPPLTAGADGSQPNPSETT